MILAFPTGVIPGGAPSDQPMIDSTSPMLLHPERSDAATSANWRQRRPSALGMHREREGGRAGTHSAPAIMRLAATKWTGFAANLMIAGWWMG
ncbi:hypothetical protein [Micromonospora sp. LA-10]|uniref:hypothetical protein n=1 Tax=Micromonospora sp. LA-10 TaxID=3446364 RepID=UPI003F6E479D